MTERLQGRIVAIEKVETAETAMSAVEALQDMNPHFTQGPGRKLGLGSL